METISDELFVDPEKMAAVIRELESASPEVLRNLITSYYVRTHDGQQIQNESPLDFIKAWLQPDTQIPIIDDPLEAIRTGYRFKPDNATAQEVVDAIFDEQVPISTVTVDDFANWPMRPFWSVDPWELLQGYIRTADRSSYFTQVTGESPKQFLNETERIFYLTRGYGRPNKYISPTDLELRRFLMAASPTALIALSDLVGICPTLQDPDVILSQLSEIDLRSIDTFHRMTVTRVSECLDRAQLCPPPCSLPLAPNRFNDTCSARPTTGLHDCNPDRVRCFTEILNSIGILPIFEYDPTLNVFTSNLSQLGSYRQVISDKKWSFEEIRGMPDPYVGGILQRLPDRELLRIEVPHLGSFQNRIDLTRLSDRLRENLIEEATQFLTQKRHFPLSDNRIGYGRSIDDHLEEMSRDELEASILRYNALIDPYEHAISPETIESILGSSVNDQINRTRALAVENEGYINQLTPQQKGTLIGGFERLLQDNLEGLEELVRSQGIFATKLILWDQTPIAIDFEDYFMNWAPTLHQIVKETLKYYIEVLST